MSQNHIDGRNVCPEDLKVEYLNELPATMQALHCGRTTLFKLIHDGELDTVKIGRKRLVTGLSIANYVDRQFNRTLTD